MSHPPSALEWQGHGAVDGVRIENVQETQFVHDVPAAGGSDRNGSSRDPKPARVTEGRTNYGVQAAARQQLVRPHRFHLPDASVKLHF